MGRGDPEGADQTARSQKSAVSGQTITSGLAQSSDMIGVGRRVSTVPEPDLPQTARRFAILANAAAGDKPRSWLAAKIAGAFSFARRRCLVATGGRTGG